MTASIELWRRALPAFGLALAFFCALAGIADAQDRVRIAIPGEAGFGRMVLTFDGRTDLPGYRARLENNVLALSFETPVDITTLPDIAASLPDYVTIARLDADGRAIRFGLRSSFQVQTQEAGERLFVDLLPPSWAGMPPPLPPEVTAEMAQRAEDAQRQHEEAARAEEAARIKPELALRVGRNPTFYRLEFNWNTPTGGVFEMTGTEGELRFDWPVAVALYDIEASMPAELVAVRNSVHAASTAMHLRFADGVTPRFYRESDRSFILDIDTAPREAPGRMVLPSADGVAPEPTGETPAAGMAIDPAMPEGGAAANSITPVVAEVGGTVRISFPFDHDVPAAAFRRGDSLWMVFDTSVQVNPPEASEAFRKIASGFGSMPSADAQTVRIDLSTARLSTLSSEGRAWVLSIGDMPLNPTVPLALNRRRDMDGRQEMVADMQHPSRVHLFHDPVVGDRLEVVTALPPAIGVTRKLSHVDFDALPSIHGLVIKPTRDGVSVDIAGPLARIASTDGLLLSSLTASRPRDVAIPQASRRMYVDLNSLALRDLSLFEREKNAAVARAALAEGRDRALARFELADFYLANRLANEAIGTLDVLERELDAEDLKERLRLTRAVADVMAFRPAAALASLSASGFADQVDALVWRAIARADTFDWAGARADAMAAESAIDSYPLWAQARFYFAGARAAIESDDPALAERYLSRLPHHILSEDESTLHTLLVGRVLEAEGKDGEAIDTYGQVIAADRRPTRAEAVFRTLQALDRMGRLDIAKGAESLATEVMMWRGGMLEAEMQALLADLQFRNGDYRAGFATVKDTLLRHADTPPVATLIAKAVDQFGKLYLDGLADALPPVEALSIYYDFRQFTPPGTRGDEMIRNLSRRLVAVDLLTQAGELLQYQVDNRLKGAARAQVAAELAAVRLADRQPDAALRVLNATRLADLPPSLERQRRVLEARALIDAGRHDLALDMLASMNGRDVQLLRAEANWAAKRYGMAAEALEALQETALAEGALSQPARMSLVKAGVGFVLAGDMGGLSRLRAKFSQAMSQSAEWGLFDFVTSETTQPGPEFREATREAAGLDLLDAFLGAYRQTYGMQSAPKNAKPGAA